MDCEERLIAQASAVARASRGATRSFVYRNLVKALPWYTSVREKLEDARYAGFFLAFNGSAPGAYHVPDCAPEDAAKCSALYHDQEQTPQHPHGDGSCTLPCDCGCVPCGEYLWDHRNQSLRQWLVDEFVLGSAHGLGNANVDGFFFDDGWSDKANPVPSWAPPTYRQCDMAEGGGATDSHTT